MVDEEVATLVNRFYGRPGSAIEPRDTLAVLAVLHGARTVREVARKAGWTSPSTAHAHLRHLRRIGLIDWPDDHQGAIHPTVRAVPFGAGVGGSRG